MNVSPVYHGAPAESRTPVEDRTYAALTADGSLYATLRLSDVPDNPTTMFLLVPME